MDRVYKPGSHISIYVNRPVLALVSLALVLRLVLAGLDRWLWYDEVYTAQLVSQDLAGLVAETIGDVHPPTYYMIVKAFVLVLGYSSFVVRLPSLLFGLGCIWLTWRIADRLLWTYAKRNRAALLATGMVAFMPFCVYYSIEARMYTMLMAFILVAVMGAISNRAWLYALGIAGAMLTHNIAVIYLPGLALVGWLWLGAGAGWGLAGLVPWLAWIPLALAQAENIGNYWIGAYTGQLVPGLLRHLSATLFWMVPNELLFQSFVVGLALLVFPVGYAWQHRADRRILTAIIMVLSPLVTLLVISRIWQSLIVARVLAGLVPFWCMLIAWWLVPVKFTMPKVALAGLVIMMLIFPLARMATEGRNRSGEMALTWALDNLGENDNLCHGSVAIAWHVKRWSISFDLARCNYLLWIGDMIKEYPMVETVKRLQRSSTLTPITRIDLEGPRAISIYKVR